VASDDKESLNPADGDPSAGERPSTPSPHPDEDEACVEAVLAGETGRFEELVGRYQRTVFTIVAGYVRERSRAEDLAQDVFLKAFANLRPLRERRRFFFWLIQIARHRGWSAPMAGSSCRIPRPPTG